jgi:TonB family protein
MPETQPLARSFRLAIREFRIASKSKRENTMNAKIGFVASCSALTMLAMCMHANAQAPVPLSAGQPVAAPKNDSSNDVFHETDPSSWARVRRVVEPKYPADALAEKAGAKVEVEVLLDTLGVVKEVRELKSDSKFPSFEKAVRDVIRKWEFIVPKTDRCVPTEAVGSVVLNFDVRDVDGKPSGVVTLTHRGIGKPPTAQVRNEVGPLMLNRNEIAKEMRDAYPRSARQFGGQANVYALITVDSKTGVPTEVEPTFVLAPDDFKNAFSRAAENVLKKARYAEFTDRATPWKRCMTIVFRLAPQ